MNKIILGILGLLALTTTVQAHHSFAVHFVGDRLVEVSGTVTEFNFNNPHGVLFFSALDDGGNEVEWRAETNSPNMLRRRGWAKDSLKPGDKITVEGFPARKESNYMRISHVAIEGGGELFAQAKAD